MREVNSLYSEIRTLNKHMGRMYHKKEYDIGLSHGQLNLLMIISKKEGERQRDLADILDIRSSSMTELVSKLESNNLISKVQDEKDLRVMRIYLTDEGKKILKNIKEGKNDYEDKIFEVLTEEEKEVMLSLLLKINNNLKEIDDLYSNNKEMRFGHDEDIINHHKAFERLHNIRKHGHNDEDHIDHHKAFEHFHNIIKHGHDEEDIINHHKVFEHLHNIRKHGYDDKDHESHHDNK